MDVKGQLPIEFLMIMGVSIVFLIPFVMGLTNANELNQAMSAARTGALQGAISDSLAVYPHESFQDYSTEHPKLLHSSGVKITGVSYLNQGFHQGYQKTKIQLRIHASSPSVTGKTDRNRLGDRINFNARKKITESFNTENITNKLYNPAFSDKYVFTTADVYWD
jgi:hypothetical protein